MKFIHDAAAHRLDGRQIDKGGSFAGPVSAFPRSPSHERMKENSKIKLRIYEMDDITGVAITAFGCSADGRHVWVTHRLRDGSEYRLVYPYEAAGHLITLFSHAARSAYLRRATCNPQEAVEGMDSNIIPVEEVRIGTAPDNSGAILHLTTADNVPIAAEIPASLLEDVAARLQHVLENLRAAVTPRGRIH
jgi:hypothetical protein